MNLVIDLLGSSVLVTLAVVFASVATAGLVTLAACLTGIDFS